jgi:hypothetical protein
LTPADAHGSTLNGHASRGTRLPKPWTLPAEWAEFARQDRPDWSDGDIARCAAKFADHWHASAQANARKLDWRATWRNWIRRETDSTRPRQSQRDDARAKVAHDIIGALGHEHDPPTDDDPRDISGEAERLDP